ncbi:DUF4153 domain-containing protein [Sulfitobacter aestuariivivens]|uniref:DUF4173 domain-containing protein n=1 Tax=Sulfitobacter aestuariivivens TaxID=2766981 RepID=A0A927D9P4_9RHOB|nr:DUF4173 domain-containing protein [Sulfitobacter aestuariivivens]MBD3665757.1 DUF4173 domain-containing protein [Sulfitobacter aestuariivivens]
MKTFLIRGVPEALQQDGWWLNAPPPQPPARTAARGATQPPVWRAGLLLALIALGDLLVWQVAPGLSLAVFGAALVLAAILAVEVTLSLRAQGQIAAGLTLALCPLVELVQPLSLLIAVLGISAILVLIAGLRRGQLALGMLRLWPCGARQGFADLRQGVGGRGDRDVSGSIGRAVLGWLMPVAMGLVFVWLLLIANPIAEQWLERFWDSDLKMPDPGRMIFWLCLAPVIWTALSIAQMRERLAAAPRLAKAGPAPIGLINPASVSRALVLFNAVFAVQTGLDVVYLYGGVGLPEGITYAEYAHRGAYPLVVTGLLAGGFALLSRRWVQGSYMLRVLLMLFVAQNVALVISSLVRLELYIEVYGLTRLRMAAAIWMGLTASGLALILWQVWQGRDNHWLVLRGGALTAAVVYVCAFISFDAAIARYNLGHDVTPDRYYLCNLGDAAKPVIAAHDRNLCATRQMRIVAPDDWREWGFRNWRARTSLAALDTGNRP